MLRIACAVLAALCCFSRLASSQERDIDKYLAIVEQGDKYSGLRNFLKAKDGTIFWSYTVDNIVYSVVYSTMRPVVLPRQRVLMIPHKTLVITTEERVEGTTRIRTYADDPVDGRIDVGYLDQAPFPRVEVKDKFIAEKACVGYDLCGPAGDQITWQQRYEEVLRSAHMLTKKK